jgi:hypothetical protein
MDRISEARSSEVGSEPPSETISRKAAKFPLFSDSNCKHFPGTQIPNARIRSGFCFHWISTRRFRDQTVETIEVQLEIRNRRADAEEMIVDSLWFSKLSFANCVKTIQTSVRFPSGKTIQTSVRLVRRRFRPPGRFAGLIFVLSSTPSNQISLVIPALAGFRSAKEIVTFQLPEISS